MQRTLGNCRVRSTILLGNVRSHAPPPGKRLRSVNQGGYVYCLHPQTHCFAVRTSGVPLSTLADNRLDSLGLSHTAHQNNLQEDWRTVTKRSSGIREFLDRPIGSWDDTSWWKARESLITCFPREAGLFLQLGDVAVVQELLQLFRRLCQERPRTAPTSDLVNSFLALIKVMIQTEKSAIQAENHKEMLHPKQRDLEFTEYLTTEVHSSMQHIIKSRYWFPDTTSAYQAMIQLSASVMNPAMAELWLNRQWEKSRLRESGIQAPNRYDYTAIVQAWAQSHDPMAAEHASFLVQQLRQTYVANAKNPMFKVTEAAYTSWIVCLTNGAASTDECVTAARNAERVLHEMWQRADLDEFWPNVTVYNAVIRAWAKAGQAEQAEAVLREMCQKAAKCSLCTPDVTSFTTVIVAWSKSRDPNAPSRAERLLRLAHEFAVMTGLESAQPNVVTVTAVLNCWAKSNLPHAPMRAEAILRRMQEHAAAGNHQLRPNAISYNICMNAWARSGECDAPERVEALFQELHQKYLCNGSARLKPDRVSYMARINVWERSRKRCPRTAAIRAAAALDEMLATNDLSIYPTDLHFSRVIAGWIQCGETLPAESLLERMVDDYSNRAIKQSAPSIYAFHFVMSAWSKQHSREAAERAESLLARMQQLSESAGLHVKPNVVSFNTCLGAWARSGAEDALHRAQALFQRMKDVGLTPDLYTYGSLLQVVARSSQEPLAKASHASVILAELRGLDLEPNGFVKGLAAQCGVS